MYAVDYVAVSHSKNNDAPRLALLDEDVVKLALDHGFGDPGNEKWNFAPWLIYNGISASDYSGDITKVQFDQSAPYFAVVGGSGLADEHVVVFSMAPNIFDGWNECAVMNVRYISDVDGSSVVFDDWNDDFYPLVVTINLGGNEYELNVKGGLRIVHVVEELRLPLKALMSLLALRASSVRSSPVN